MFYVVTQGKGKCNWRFPYNAKRTQMIRLGKGKSIPSALLTSRNGAHRFKALTVRLDFSSKFLKSFKESINDKLIN